MNEILKKLLLSAFVMSPFALTGCAPECVDVSDCAQKGSNFTCVSGKCTAGSPSPGGGGGTATGGGGGGTATGGGGSATGGGGGATGGGGGATGGGGGGATGGGGGTDAGTDGGIDLDGGTDAGLAATQIAQARANAQQSLTTPVNVSGATVTYLKPVIGTEDAGFFVQASASGPAIFMNIDPSSLTPAPQVGDQVAFTATAYALITGVSQITTVSNWQRLSSGGSVGGFTQNLNTNPAVAASIDTLEAELVSIRGVLDAGFSSAGPPYVGAFMATTLSPADAIRFRAPQTLVDALDLERGCDISVGPTPLWRFSAQAQPSAWLASEVVVNSCPGPTVVNAVPLSATSVRVDFSRTIQPSSVLNTGAQFTFDNGVIASAAAVSGRAVTVTTSPLDGGALYMVTAGSTITDTRGSALGMPNSDTFIALRPLDCGPRVVISQVYGGGGNSGATFTHDFVELHNRSNAPVDVSGWSINYAPVMSASWTRVTFPATSIIPAGAFFLIQGQSTAAVGAPLPTPNITVTPTFNINAAEGKLILSDATVTASFSTACPAVTGIVDKFGFGSTANCVEGSFGPGHTNTMAAFRREFVGMGSAEIACFDSNSNDRDFVLSTPAPRNATTVSTCAATCPGL